MHSPKIEKIEVAARGDVRRAKLYYLRERVGKRARVRERRYTGPEEHVEPGLLHDPSPQLEAEAAAATGAVDAEGATAEEVVEAGGAEDTAATEEATPGAEQAAESAEPQVAAPGDGDAADARAPGPDAGTEARRPATGG